MSEPGDVAKGPGWELRCGRWQDVLADVMECDAVITDPPYSERTHAGHRTDAADGRSRKKIHYRPITETEQRELASGFARAAWLVQMTSHDWAPAVERSMQAVGRYVFAPLPCLLPGMTVRMAGDGPSSWTVWLLAARRRDAHRWGTLPGGYYGRPGSGYIGGKPLWLMREIVRDYSRHGDLIVDPYAGSGTTLLAAVMEGRRAIGAEMDPNTFDLAVKRLRNGITPDMFAEAERKAREQAERKANPPRNQELFE